VVLQSDSFTVRQCKNLIIIHHRVHIFDPQRIHIAVKEDVTSLLLVDRLVDVSEYMGEETIRPVSGHRVKDTVQLGHRTCLEM
jgi:hypothetical protein